MNIQTLENMVYSNDLVKKKKDIDSPKQIKLKNNIYIVSLT